MDSFELYILAYPIASFEEIEEIRIIGHVAAALGPLACAMSQKIVQMSKI